MRYIQPREKLFSLLVHTKKHDTGADGYHAGPECVRTDRLAVRRKQTVRVWNGIPRPQSLNA